MRNFVCKETSPFTWDSLIFRDYREYYTESDKVPCMVKLTTAKVDYSLPIHSSILGLGMHFGFYQ